MSDIYRQLEQIGILPVVTAQRASATVKLAETLLQGGIACIEITCRTACALDAICAVKQAGIDILLGAGTVTGPALLDEAVDAGADFIVSPGITESLLHYAAARGIAFLPGISTASEIMVCRDHGFQNLKIFPAVAGNALQLLPAFHAVFPDTRFCPSGGITIDNMQDFAALPNVFCIGASWMVKPALVNAEDWPAIAGLARDCMSQLISLESARCKK